MSWIDIAIIALVVLCGLTGLLRGFKKSLLSLGAFIIAFVLAFFLSNVIAEALLGVDAIKGFVLGNGAFEEEFSLANWIYHGLGENNGGISSESFLGKNFFAPITEIIQSSTVNISPDKGLAMYTAFLMFSAICGVGIFLVIRFLLMIVTAIIKSYIGKKKTVGSRLAGFLISAVQGAVLAFAVTIVFTCFGGLVFAPGFDVIENEYESPSAVLATPMYEGAYAIRNKLFLPNEGMYGRIVNLVVKKDYENPDTEKLTGDRLQLFVEAGNLNYDYNYEGGVAPWSVVDAKRAFNDEHATLRSAREFAEVGFHNVMQAVLDYNKQAAAVIDDTTKLGDITDFNKYVGIVKGNTTSAHIAMNTLVSELRAYIEDYKTGSKLTDQREIEAFNTVTLSNDYNKVKAALAELENRYGDLKPVFGECPALGSLVPERVNAGQGRHVCAHVCEICGNCTDPDCAEWVCSYKCNGHHVCESACETCGKCTNAECTEEACADKCKGHEPPPEQGGEGEGGEVTPPEQGGEGEGGEVTPPEQGGEGEGGEVTPPEQGGEVTPPEQGGEENNEPQE